MTPAVYQVFTELHQERRLDTSRVFLYKGKPIGWINTAFKSGVAEQGSVTCIFMTFAIRRVQI